MARVTVQDCLERLDNRFALVHLASKRAMQLRKDAEPLVEDPRANKEIVTSLREIAEGRITTDEDVNDILSGRIHKMDRRSRRRRRR